MTIEKSADDNHAKVVKKDENERIGYVRFFAVFCLKYQLFHQWHYNMN